MSLHTGLLWAGKTYSGRLSTLAPPIDIALVGPLAIPCSDNVPIDELHMPHLQRGQYYMLEICWRVKCVKGSISMQSITNMPGLINH